MSQSPVEFTNEDVLVLIGMAYGMRGAGDNDSFKFLMSLALRIATVTENEFLIAKCQMEVEEPPQH